MLENNATPYKRRIHQSFVSLVVNPAEVDSIGRASKTLGIYEHKRTHELARVHRSQKIAVHVFA